MLALLYKRFAIIIRYVAGGNQLIKGKVIAANEKSPVNVTQANFRGSGVSQLVERSLPIPEVRIQSSTNFILPIYRQLY